MTQTEAYIKRLSALQEGELSSLRLLAGQPLNSSLLGFDLFTGLWWPLRQNNKSAPRREPSWLVAKLFSSFRIPHIKSDSAPGPSLPEVLGQLEPLVNGQRFQTRFDALLCADLASLEPHLRWALREVARGVAGQVPHARDVKGLDWVQLLNDLSIWDRGVAHRHRRDVHNVWAEKYLNNSASKERKA